MYRLVKRCRSVFKRLFRRKIKLSAKSVFLHIIYHVGKQYFRGDKIMAKKGMKRPERTHTKPKNDVPPVPESIYSTIDNDLGIENLEQDTPECDKGEA